MKNLDFRAYILCALGVLLGNPVAAQQPYASYWHPMDLLSWSPETDPDAPYNRSGVELRDVFYDTLTQANSHARPDEADIVSLAAFYATSYNPSQGADTFNTYAFNYWQYCDILNFWGGSAGEGLILAPSPDVIDAGHRNGVPVLGTIFFPPNVYGGQIQWVHDLVQKTDTIYPVADKLIEAAEYYGFDGWFINQETQGGDSALAYELQAFMKYMQQHAPGLHIMWYDAMIRTGAIAWQNELNGNNQMFFEDSGRVSDEFFLNFWWNATDLANSRTKAIELERDPYEVFAGADVEAGGYNTYVNFSTLFPEGQPHVLSLGFYRPDWCYNSSTSPEDFYQKDNRFWVGANRDPSNTTTGHFWKGMAHYVPEKSPVNDIPFVTNFNTGQGYVYAVNGDVLRTRNWHNKSLQDILPTYRWIARTDSTGGTPLYPDLVWDDAYYGGTCLKVTGDLNAVNTTNLILYKTQLNIVSNTNISVAYSRDAAGVPSCMKIGLAFADAPGTFEYTDVGTAATDGWNTDTFNIGGHSGRTLILIALRFESATQVDSFMIKVGQIAVRNGPVTPPAPASGLYIESYQFTAADTVNVRLRWEHSTDPVYCYNVYRRNPDTSLTFLGATPNNAFFVSTLARVEPESTVIIEVEAVGLDFVHASHATTIFDWSSGISEHITHNTDPAFAINLPGLVRDNARFMLAVNTPGHVTVSVYNVNGQHVATLTEATYTPGTHELGWQSHDAQHRALSSGIYFVQVVHEDHTRKHTSTGKVVYVR